jgi:hypothetical protein
VTTTENVRSRPLPVVLLAVVAVLAAMLAAMLAAGAAGSRGAQADGRTGRDHHVTQTAGHASAVGAHVTARRAMTARQVRFHDRMRKLWEDHVTWTRLAIVAFVEGSPGFDATAARLMRNQADIGNAIEPFYGRAAGRRLTALLNDHIGIAVELLQAAKAGNGPAVEGAAKRWYANSDDIADFLAAANPRDWPRSTMRAAMRGHLDQTLAEAQHELAGDHAASVAEYDRIHRHILGMADVLSEGIMRSFPGRFR